MPNRMIRDGIIESEAVLSLPVEARWLYVTILLSADDIGLFEATPFKLARRADVRREHADKLVAMLVDADLVRLYAVDGKRYGFIPKFNQRLQIKRIKHAAPPDALLQDELDTLNKIKHLASKTTVGQRCSTDAQRCSTDGQPSEPEPEPELVPTGKTVGASRKRSASTKGSSLKADWVLTKELGEWAMSECGMTREAVKAEAEKFRDYWVAIPGAKGRKADWPATWRNWCRNAQPARLIAGRTQDVAGVTVPSNAAVETQQYLARPAPTPEEIKAAAAKHRLRIAEITGKAA